MRQLKRKTLVVEGVAYFPFRIRIVLKDGSVKRWSRWAPAACFMADSLRRELHATDIDRSVERVIIAPR